MRSIKVRAQCLPRQIAPNRACRVALLLVGNELTDGRISDRHGAWISERLTAAAFVVGEIAVIPDLFSDYVRAARRLCRSYDVVVCCGGLGPTADDHTRAVFAALTRRRTRFGFARFRRAARSAPFRALPNDNGSAEGMYGRYRGAVLCALPGPVGELRPMFASYLLPALLGEFPRERKRVELLCSLYDVPESRLDRELCRLRDGAIADAAGATDTVGAAGAVAGAAGAGAAGAIAGAAAGLSFAGLRWSTRLCDYRIELILFGCSLPLLRRAAGLLRRAVGRWRLALGARELGEHVLRDLRACGRRLVTVESCSGGQVAALLIQYDGASEHVWGAIVPYRREAKESFGIDGRMLARHGAVSQAVAEEMARAGLRSAKGGADIAVAVTGLCGASPSDERAERGEGWVALADGKGRCVARRVSFPPAQRRRVLQRRFSIAALVLAREYLRGEGLRS